MPINIVSQTPVRARGLVLASGLLLAGVTSTGQAADVNLITGLLSGGNPGASALLGGSGGGGLAGLGVLSGENSGTGGLLGLDVINNDNLLGSQLGGAPLLELGDVADPLADAAQDLGLQIREGVGSNSELSGLAGNNSLDPLPVDLAPLAGLALGDGADAAENVVGAGLLSGDGVVNNNAVSAIIIGGNASGNGDLAGAAVIAGNNVANGGALGAGVITGDNSGNGGLVGTSVIGGDSSGNGGLIGASVLSGDSSGNGGLVGASVLSGSNGGNSGLVGASVLSGGGSGNGGLLGNSIASGPNSGNSGFGSGAGGGANTDLLSVLFAQFSGADNAGSLGNLGGLNGGLIGARIISGSAMQGSLLDLEALTTEQLLALSLSGNSLLATGSGSGELTGALDQLRLGLLAALVEPRQQLLAMGGTGSPFDNAVPEIAIADLVELGIGPGTADTGERLVAVHLFSGSGVGNGDRVSVSAIGNGNNANAGLIGAGVLEGNNSGNGELAGAGLLSGNNVGIGGLLGAVVLSGNNSGQGGLLGAGVLSGNNSGVTGPAGLAGLGVINGSGSGNGGANGVAIGGTDAGQGDSGQTGFGGLGDVLAQLDVLLGSGDRPLVDAGAVSGGNAETAELFDLSVLESGMIVDARLDEIPVLQLEDPAGLVELAEDLRGQLRDLGQQLVPTLVGLPGGETLVLLLSTDLTEGTEDLVGLTLGPVLDDDGNVLGLAVLRDRPDSELPGLGLAALAGNGDGNGSEAGAAVLSGDDTGNGGLLGAAALSGDGSGAARLVSVGALNDGPAGTPNGTGGGAGNGGLPGAGSTGTNNPIAGLGGSTATGGGTGTGNGASPGNGATGTDNPVAGFDDSGVTGTDTVANNGQTPSGGANDSSPDGGVQDFNPDDDQIASNNGGQGNADSPQTDAGNNGNDAGNSETSQIAADLDGPARSDGVNDRRNTDGRQDCVVRVREAGSERNEEVDCQRDPDSPLTSRSS